MNHFLNTNASDLSRARTVGLTNLITAPFPVLVVGGQTLHQFFAALDGTIESWSGAADRTLRVTIGDSAPAPAGGKWTLQVGSGSVNVVESDVDAAGLEYLLNSDATVITEGLVDVYAKRPGEFLIAHRLAGATSGMTISGVRLFPDCTPVQTVLATGSATVRQLALLSLFRTVPLQTTAFSSISTPYAGWSGTLDLSGAAAVELIKLNGEPKGALIEAETVLTVETIDGDGNVATLYQTPITLRAANYSTTLASTSMTQNFFARPNVTGLVSNASDATKLGGLTTSDGTFPIGSTVQCLFSSDVVALFIRKSSTSAQSWPFLIRPYDYNASSNPYQWVLDRVTKQGVPCTWDADLAAFTYVVSEGNANAVALAVDQTGFSLPA